MRNILITAAAVTAFATFASVPAGAAENWGPTKVGNECFKASSDAARDARHGYWAACPQAASLSTKKKK